MQDATLLVVRRPGSGFPVKQKEPPNVAVGWKRVKADQQTVERFGKPEDGFERGMDSLPAVGRPWRVALREEALESYFLVTPSASLNPIL